MQHREIVGFWDYTFRQHSEMVDLWDYTFRQHREMVGLWDYAFRQHREMVGLWDYAFRQHREMVGLWDYTFRQHREMILYEIHCLKVFSSLSWRSWVNNSRLKYERIHVLLSTLFIQYIVTNLLLTSSALSIYVMVYESLLVTKLLSPWPSAYLQT